MKAVRVSAPGLAQIVEVPRPEPRPGEALVRVSSAALCATDRKLAAAGSEPPRVPGHEVVGTLEDGIVVGVHPDIGCGECAACLTGFENRCPRRSSIGLDRDGGLAEWLAVPRDHAVPLDDVPAEVAPVLEPLACCLHSVAMLGVRPGDAALVVGAGAMGILAMWALQAEGAPVVVVQRSHARRELAADLGADATAGVDGPVDVLGAQPRIAIVTAPGADALTFALETVAVGGVVHAFAGTPGGALVDGNVVHYRHLALVGSTGSTLADYRRARDLVASGTIDLRRLPRKTIALEEVPRALAGAPDGRTLKVVVDVAGGSP
jgi:threonine dehydrogenase-like Zn-dependent dehydrogenase